MAKNMAELAAMLEKKFKSSLENEVKQEVTETMQEHIQSDVYDAYTPTHYDRTYQLMDDIEGEMINENTLKVENTRSENGRDIVEVIETGKGYEWGYIRNLDEEIGARPFVENTKEELRSTGKHIEAFKRGLKREGIDVK